MNWHEELLKRGFTYLESTTRTYGYKNGKVNFTGSIEWERKGNIIAISPDDRIQKDDVEVFCPFIRTDNDKRPNDKHQSIKLKNIEDIERYIAELVELADTQDSKPCAD